MIPKRIFTALKRWAVLSAGPLIYYDYINPLDTLYRVYKNLVGRSVKIDDTDIIEEKIPAYEYIEPITLSPNFQDDKLEKVDDLNYFANDILNEVSIVYENSSSLYLLLTWVTVLFTSLLALRYFQGKNIYIFLKSLTEDGSKDDLENNGSLKEKNKITMKLKDRTDILSNYKQKFSDFSNLMSKKESDIFENLETYLAKYPEVDIECLNCLNKPNIDDLSDEDEEYPTFENEEEHTLESDVSDEDLIFNNEDRSDIQNHASSVIEEDNAYEAPKNNAIMR